MRNLLLTSFMLVIFSAKLFSSGIQVLNTTVSTNTDKKSAQVKFTLMWDHSWRLESGTGPANWDAAWVFIKFRTLPGDNWDHGYISRTASDHKMPANAAFSIGSSIAVVGGSYTQVGVGAFIHRNEPGSGTVTFTDCELYWNFTLNGLTGGEQVEVCVLATEMVYITPHSYWLGDMTSTGTLRRNPSQGSGGLRAIESVNVAAPTPGAWMNYFSNTWITGSTNLQGANSFYPAVISSNAGATPDDASLGNYQIRTGAAINSASTTLYSSYSSIIHSNYPRGINAFYCMKYEITQGEYLHFLNKNLVAVKNAGTYYPNTVPTDGRYGIKRIYNSANPSIPAEYVLEIESSAFLPCNYLNTQDVYGWLIWAGLRPMTELEFEKICRGPEAIPAVGSQRPQYAWGSTDIQNALGYTQKGQSNEGPLAPDQNVAVSPATTVNTAIGTAGNTLDGPMRAGGFASAVSSRVTSGASYYGVMEMSGNLWERTITVGLDAGRNFQGLANTATANGHGNGRTGPNAAPDLPVGGAWPALTGAGLGFRGGSYLDHSERARISDRMFINHNSGATRHASFGGRGVRSEFTAATTSNP